MSAMSGTPSIFTGTDFKYWKMRVECFLEASGYEIWHAVRFGYPDPVNPENPTNAEKDNLKANAKARNIICAALSKDIFLRVSSYTSAKKLWNALVEIHEGTESVRNERYEVLKRKLDAFAMLPNENANDMFSRLNSLVDEINGLGVKTITDEDITRKILSVLPQERYNTIATFLHQCDLSRMTPTHALGKIMAYELFANVNVESPSSSSKNTALKADYSSRTKKKVVKKDEDDDTTTLLRKANSLLKTLSMKGFEFDPCEKKFMSKKGKSSSNEFVCFNCRDPGHIARDCPKKKNSNTKGFPRKKEGGKWKTFKTTKQAFVGEWVTDDEGEEEEEGDDDVEEDDDNETEEVAGVAIKESKPSPLPPICLMASSVIVESDSDEDDESEESLIEELSNMLMKTTSKCQALEKSYSKARKELEVERKHKDELVHEIESLRNDMIDFNAKHEKLKHAHIELQDSYIELDNKLSKNIQSSSMDGSKDVASSSSVNLTSSCESMLLKENEKLKEEVAKLKDCVKRLTKGQSAFNEMIIHQTISQNGKGLGYEIGRAHV
jgi:cell division protein FtsB